MSQKLNHIAFIPDGNRRFAKEKGIPSLEGHRLGYDRFKEVIGWCEEQNIREVSFWGFSTENWKRSKEEVGYLMDLFVGMLSKDLNYLIEKNIKLRVIGRRNDLSKVVRNAIEKAEERTRDLTGGVVNLLFNYGGRPEFEDAVRKALESGMNPQHISEESVNELLWSKDMSDVDMVVRTSGEQRLSGFLPWKAAYGELYFSPKYWPAFEKGDLQSAVDWYYRRERRFGGDSSTQASAA